MVKLVKNQISEDLRVCRILSGAMWDAGGVDFGLFYGHATRVEICLFDERGKRETARVELREYADEIGAVPAQSRARRNFTRSSHSSARISMR